VGSSPTFHPKNKEQPLWLLLFFRRYVAWREAIYMGSPKISNFWGERVSAATLQTT